MHAFIWCIVGRKNHIGLDLIMLTPRLLPSSMRPRAKFHTRSCSGCTASAQKSAHGISLANPIILHLYL